MMTLIPYDSIVARKQGKAAKTVQEPLFSSTIPYRSKPKAHKRKERLQKQGLNVIFLFYGSSPPRRTRCACGV